MYNIFMYIKFIMLELIIINIWTEESHEIGQELSYYVD